MSLSAESIENTSELNGNVSTSDNQGLLGLLLQIEETVAIDSQFASRDFHADRMTSGSNEDVLSFKDVISNLDLMGRDEFTLSDDVIDFGAAKQVAIDSL